MKILTTEVTFTLKLPRELEGDEVSDLSSATGHVVELISVTPTMGDDDMQGDAFYHTFGFAGLAKTTKEDEADAYLKTVAFVESLGD
jgi:hypothetical protein